MRFLALVFMFSLMGPIALANSMSSKNSKEQQKEGSLRKVPAQKVCMINDQVFDKDQIRVDVEKKAYYGCCEMCKERLEKDASARQATDPVSGKSVDKAKAVIGAKDDGSVLYFENEANFKAYSKSTQGT